MPARCVWRWRLALRCSFPPRQLPPPPPPRSGVVVKGGVVLRPRRKAVKQKAPSPHVAAVRAAGSPCKQVGLRPPRVHAGAYHPRAPRQPAPCARQAGHPSRVPVIHGLSAGVVCGVLASSAAARLPPPRRVISRTANASAWGGWYDDRAQKRTAGNVS